MSQSDYVVSNGTGAAVRSDINGQLAAIVTQNSGATEPTTTYAYMRWADTTAGVMKMRNGANSAWITLYQLDGEWSTIAFENGTAAAPSIYFKDSGTDTGFYSPGANQVGISTGGTARLIIDSNGNVDIDSNTLYVDAANNRVGLGTSTPGTLLHLQSSDRSVFRVTTSDTGTSNQILFNNGSNYHYGVVGTVSGTSGVTGDVYGLGYTASASADFTPVLSWTADTARVGIGTTSVDSSAKLAVSNGGAEGLEFQAGSTSGLCGILSYNRSGSAYTTLRYDGSEHIYRTSGTERARIDSSGRLLVGTSSSRSVQGDHTPQIQLEGASYQSSTASIINNENGSAGAYLFLGKARGGSVGSNTIVNNGDTLGQIRFLGSDGSGDFSSGAQIDAVVDGTPGSGDLPSRLVFSTTADGASSPTERFLISSYGEQRMFSSSSSYTLVLNNGTSAGTTYLFLEGRYSATNNSGSTGTRSLAITTNGNVYNTNGTYTTISDARLKENIVDARSQWSDIRSLRVCNFNYRAETNYETHKQIGLIAQEAELVCPGLVTAIPVAKGDVILDADGNELSETKTVNMTVLYMKAVKALQEAMERIEQLETEMAEVKAQLQAS